MLSVPRRRFLLIVLDGCGVGELPDAAAFGPGDPGSNTLGNLSRAVGGLSLPHLGRLGFGGITPMVGVPPVADASACWGRLAEVSRGKDTVTGHWEMMGVRTDVAFPTYPNGFPADVLTAFEAIIGTKTLGNRPASGTEILRELGEEHCRTGFPIVYTSADSVFQVAAHETPAIFGLDRLYDACAAMRERLVAPHHVGRVIARPFVGTASENFRRTENRRDYPLPPPRETVPDRLRAAGKRVHAIGVVSEVFGGRGITSSERTRSNPEHQAAIGNALRSPDWDFLFANLEDFDMLYGHRNDPAGFARLLSEFDTFVGETLLPSLAPGDLVGITADHGNDPTTPSTDHSREYAPLLLFGPALTTFGPLGDRATFADWGATVCDYLGVDPPGEGTSFLPASLKRAA
ncbi:MAG: phosphopentomutase [Capsulimonadales bacterium]|nr:phosphopentomutase [Capsulimonadales bacterium]